MVQYYLLKRTSERRVNIANSIFIGKLLPNSRRFMIIPKVALISHAQSAQMDIA
jgi:hypothetical protein